MARPTRQTTGDVPAKRDPRDNLRVGGGRPKGVPNKNTAAIKEMILQALDKQGGADYLFRQADANPVAFMSLIGKVLPLQVTGEDGGAVKIEAVVRRVVYPAGKEPQHG